MRIAQVVGSAVSTVKDPRTTGLKLLVVRDADSDGTAAGETYVAADAVGAGEGELVLVARGSAARETEHTRDRPIDATIMGILDSLEVDGHVTFRKS